MEQGAAEVGDHLRAAAMPGGVDDEEEINKNG